MRLLLFLFISLSLWSAMIAQPLHLKVLGTDITKAKLAATTSWPDSIQKDSSSLLANLTKLSKTLISSGYLEASIDTIIVTSNHYTAILHAGPLYKWLSLSAENVPKAWLNKAGFRSRLYIQKPLLADRWLRLQKELALIAASNGFPFAKVYLSNIRWQQAGLVSANIEIDKNTLIHFEKIVLSGEAQISEDYLQSHLGLIPGQVYNEALIKRVKQRLLELPFVQLAQEPKVQFIGNQARLLLELNPKKASRFDFIIGVLPKSQQTGRLLVTAQLDGALQNSFGKGERIALAFEQLRPLTQELDLAFSYPYLLQLPFGIDAQLNLYRRDTNFINLNWQIGVDYLLTGGKSVQLFWSQNQTNLLSIDSNLIRAQGRLPDTLDVSRRTFGLGLKLNRLDYKNNPRQGWEWLLRAGLGQKTIRLNNEIEVIGLESLYDSLTLKSAQYRLETQAAYYQPIGQRGVLKTGISGAAIIAPEPVLANEQFRIGGNRLLRGFDEEAIFATNYGVATLEYRFLLTTNSYLYAFFDWARVDSRSLNSSPSTTTILTYQGLGTGITFETRAGLFALSLAFGRETQQAFDFGAPKVHFGYISLF